MKKRHQCQKNWSPMTTLRDPRAKSVNGDMKGRGKG